MSLGLPQELHFPKRGLGRLKKNIKHIKNIQKIRERHNSNI